MTQIDTSIHYTPTSDGEWITPRYEKTRPMPEDVKDPKPASLMEVLTQNTIAIDQLKDCLIAIENKLNGNFNRDNCCTSLASENNSSIISEVNKQYDQLAKLLSMADYIYNLL